MKRINVFFIHAQWLKDREKVISEFNRIFGKYNFKDIRGTKVRVITDHDPNNIGADIISKSVSYAPLQDELAVYNGFLKNLHVFQLSNALKHYKALEEIVNNTDEGDINIILEDDVLYEDKMCMNLEKIINDLPEVYDIVFLGLPSNVDPKKRNEVKFQPYREMFKVLPYSDSYILSKAGAKKLYDNYLPIKFVTNVQLSYTLDKIKMEGLIAIPNIFMDGSKFGMFLSVLNPNNNLMFNNDYMKIRMALNEELTPQSKEMLEKTFKESPIRVHPDFQHLQALYLTKIQKYDEAQKVFEDALKVFQGNNCILNHESQFLKDYLSIYKYMQKDI